MKINAGGNVELIMDFDPQGAISQKRHDGFSKRTDSVQRCLSMLQMIQAVRENCMPLVMHSEGVWRAHTNVPELHEYVRASRRKHKHNGIVYVKASTDLGVRGSK
jgi:hypothetical protein